MLNFTVLDGGKTKPNKANFKPDEAYLEGIAQAIDFPTNRFP